MSAMTSDDSPTGGRRRRDVPTDSPPLVAASGPLVDPHVDPHVDEALIVGARARAEAQARLLEEERRLLRLEADLRRAAIQREAAERRLSQARGEAARLAREAERAVAEGIAAAERVAAVQRLAESVPPSPTEERAGRQAAPSAEISSPKPLPSDPVMAYAAAALTAQAAEAAREAALAPASSSRLSPPGHRAEHRRNDASRASGAASPPPTRGPRRLGGAFRTAGVVVCVGVAALAGSAYLDSQKALATSELCLSAKPIDRALVRGVLGDLGRGRIAANTAGAARLRGMVTTGLSSVSVASDLSGDVPTTARALQGAERRMATMIDEAAATAAAGKDWKATPSPQELVGLRNRLFGAEDAFRAACSDLVP